MHSNYLKSAISQFNYYKLLGNKTLNQLSEQDIHFQYNTNCNSIAIIINHLHGNMLSRWTDFLISDGEKVWRNRDIEFENFRMSKSAIMEKWENGWAVLLDNLESLNDTDLDKIVLIRNEKHTVIEAINRQLAHYAYHVGQIVFVGKMCAKNWKSLSIPKGESEKFNESKFKQNQ